MDMAYTTAPTNSLLCLMFTVTGLVSSTVFASDADLVKQLEMMEQMDLLDRLEFQELLEQADRCAEQLDFPCSRQHMKEARPLMFDPEMEQRYSASQTYFQDMQTHAAGLIQGTIDDRPLAQLKDICPDPFDDYSSREANSNDFNRVADRFVNRYNQYEEFMSCKEAFHDIYDLDSWADSLAQAQALEKQLDNRSKAAVHELSRASEIRKIDNYIDEVKDSYLDLQRDFTDQLNYIARRNSSSSSSGNWMSALNTSLQAMNQQMQANNQQLQNNLKKLQQDAFRQSQKRREESRTSTSTKVREQERLEKLMAEKQRQQQLLQERQKQIIANSKPAITGKSPTRLSTQDAIAQAQEKTRTLSQQRQASMQSSGVQPTESTASTGANRYVGAGRDYQFTGQSEQYYKYETALELAQLNLENQASEFCGTSMKTEIRWGEPVCKESSSEKEHYRCSIDGKVNCYENFCDTRFCGTEH